MGQPVRTVCEQDRRAARAVERRALVIYPLARTHQRTAIVHGDEASTVEVATVARNDEAVADEVAATVHSRYRHHAEGRAVQDVEEAEFRSGADRARGWPSHVRNPPGSPSHADLAKSATRRIRRHTDDVTCPGAEVALLTPVDQLVVGELQLRGGRRRPLVIVDAVRIVSARRSPTREAVQALTCCGCHPGATSGRSTPAWKCAKNGMRTKSGLELLRVSRS